MPRTAAPGSDPRSIVTPHAFTVAPDLLGAPLAPPMRRLGALLLDLLLVALLTNAGGVLLGIFAALFLFRMATRPTGDSDPALGRAFRGAVGCIGSVVLFVTVLTVWGAARNTAERVLGRTDSQPVSVTGAGRAPPTPAAAIQTPPPEASGAASSPAPDRGAAEGSSLPSDSVTRLEAELAAAQERHREVEARLARARAELEASRRDTGIRAFLVRSAEDLGLGVGWGALYFSLFLAWGRGRTPGKRLFGIRVVRLDRRPIGGWNAFERYGGYAAGFATGLLGFAQVYWDANRQATHDKIAGTVVILDGKRPVPGPWLRQETGHAGGSAHPERPHPPRNSVAGSNDRFEAGGEADR